MAPWFVAKAARTDPLHRVLLALSPVHRALFVTVSDAGVWLQVVDAVRACAASVLLDENVLASFRTDPGAAGAAPEGSATICVALPALMHALHLSTEWEAERRGDGGGLGGSLGGGLGAGDGDGPPHKRARGRWSDDGAPADYTFTYTPGQALTLSGRIGKMTLVSRFTLYDPADLVDGVAADAAGGPQLDRASVAMHAIIKGREFRRLFGNFAAMRTTRLTIYASDSPSPRLLFIGRGDIANATVTLPPARHDQPLETFHLETRAMFTYDFRLLDKSREGVRTAERVSLRFDRNGVLSIQTMHKAGAAAQGPIIDFRFYPEEPEDE